MILVAQSVAAPPPLEQYQYPGARVVGTGPTWRDLQTTEGLTKVVDFYKAKFPKPQIITSDGAQFDDTGPDTGGLTVSVIKVKDGTEIILRRPEKDAD